MRKYNLNDGHMKYIALLAQISMQLMNIQQYDAQIYYTELHQNYAINVARMTRNSFMPLTKDWISLQEFSQKLLSLNEVSWTSHCTEFYKNKKNVENTIKISHMLLGKVWAFTVLTFTKPRAADQHGMEAF
jgi:hypothetical protein